MEIEVKQRNQRNRRRERAQRMQAQRESKVKDGDSGEDESPAREKPPRPAARRKKSREPLGEEDIIDGFAIMAFRTYEDLEAAVKCVSSPRIALNNKPRVPLAALAGDAARNLPPNNVNSHGITLLQDAGTSDDSGRASERLTGSSVAPRDPDSSRDRLSDASSRCSSGKGYICDSEGDDDKASPDNSRNASPRFIDSSMEDASDGSLFRVTGPGPGAGGAAGGAAGAVSAAAGGKSELAARGGSGGALALSRAPVGGSASPAPAPLPQPAPSPAPAALPPPAPPPPPARSAAAHIPSLPSPQRPSADSPTPAPAPSPHFPSQTAYHAALPDYRHTNHEARSKPPPPEPPPALPDYRQTGHEARKPDLPAPAAAPDFRLTNHEARKPEQPPAPAPDFRLTNHEARGKPPAPEPPAPAPDYRHTNHETRPKPAALDLPAPAPDYRHTNHEARAKPPAPPRAPAPAAPASRYPVPPIGSSHITSLSSSIHNRAISPMQSLYSHVPKLALPPYARMSHAAKDEPAYSAPAGYPPLYAPYAASMHSPYLPPAHSPRNTLDMRTSLPSSPQIPPKPKTIQSLAGAPGGPGAGAPLHAPHSFSPRHSPSRERDNFSNISSLSRGSGSTPVSSSPAPQASAGGGAGGAVMPPLAVSLAPPAPPVAASLAPPIPSQLSAPLSTPLSASLPGPLPAPLATSAASLPAAAAPLAAPTPTPAAPAAAPAPHTLAPVPTIGSISSGAKPPAHWGVTPGTNERTGFAPAPPLFAAPLAAPLAAPMPAPLAAPLAAPMPAPLAPPNPTPFSAESLFQSSPGADLLRRELDNRFLAAAGFSVRTEMHHHQHQHTHVHQHPHAPHAPHALLHPAPPQPMFKDVSKMPSLYRAGLGLGYPYPAPLLHPPGPYAPPAPLAPYAPKPVVSAASDVPKPARPVAKTGKWNAMHVRIAWEIYNHQQKEKAGVDKDKLRAFPAAPAPPAPAPPAPAPPAPPAPFRSPYDLPPAYLPGHHPHLAGMSPFARYGASGFPGAPPPFALSPYARELLPAPLHHHPLHDPWRAPAPAPAPAPRAPPLAREHEERARRERDERERERREREDRERRKQREREMERVRQRSPLRNGEPPKEERKEAPRHAVPYAAAWEPYRFDPLHHMRFTPLVEAAIRAEEDRAKMLSAYAHHQQLKSSALLHRGLPLPPLPMPLHAPHALPLDLLKKEEPR